MPRARIARARCRPESGTTCVTLAVCAGDGAPCRKRVRQNLRSPVLPLLREVEHEVFRLPGGGRLVSAEQVHQADR